MHSPAPGGAGKGPALPARLRARLRMEHWDWLHLGLASGLGLVSLLYVRSLLQERQLAASLHKKDRAMARYVMQVGCHPWPACSLLRSGASCKCAPRCMSASWQHNPQGQGKVGACALGCLLPAEVLMPDVNALPAAWMPAGCLPEKKAH